jgi:hypothetical protein
MVLQNVPTMRHILLDAAVMVSDMQCVEHVDRVELTNAPRAIENRTPTQTNH